MRYFDLNPRDGSVRIFGLTALEFIGRLVDRPYQLSRYPDDFHDYWYALADYARANFKDFVEDVLDDYLDEHLPRLFHTNRYRIEFRIHVAVPDDIEFYNCHRIPTDDPPESGVYETINIEVESRYFRTFALQLPVPNEFIFHNPREMKQWIESVGGSILGHIRPAQTNSNALGGYVVPQEYTDRLMERFVPDSIQWREHEVRLEHVAHATWYTFPTEKTEEQKQAEKKALNLLLSHCNRKQKSDYKKNSWFIVKGKSGTRYRIRKANQINVDVLDDDNEVKYKLCTVPDKHSTGLPIEDQLLAQKTLIELNEQLFLDTAIKHGGFNGLDLTISVDTTRFAENLLR